MRRSDFAKLAAVALFTLASASCQEKLTKTSVPAKSECTPPPGMRQVPELALFSQCLAHLMATPPGTTGSRNWLDFGEVKINEKTYGWIVVEPFGKADAMQARAFVSMASVLGKSNKGDNVHNGLCGNVWEPAVEQTFLTLIIQTGGDDEKGEYRIYGGQMGRDSADQGRVATGISRAEARKKAVGMAAAELGATPKLVYLSGVTHDRDWGEALH